MLRIRMAVLSLLVSLFVTPVFAAYECGTCQGHYFMQNSSYPFAEDISLNDVTMTNTWAAIQTGCMTARNASHTNIPLNGTNLSSSVATNSVLRAFVALKNATPGTRYE